MSAFVRNYCTQGFGLPSTAYNGFQEQANKSRASIKIAKILTCFYHTNTPFCTFSQQFHFEKLNKIRGDAASYVTALFMTLDRRMVQTRHPFG